MTPADNRRVACVHVRASPKESEEYRY